MDNRERIQSKRQMYAMLNAGLLGNTTRQFFGIDEWLASPDRLQYPLWGVRSMKAGGKATRLDVPADEVEAFVRAEHGGLANISPMVDPWMVFRCEVQEDRRPPCGLRVFGTADRVLKWREALNKTGREWTGAAAVAVLKHYLTASDWEDLTALLERFPGHVVEMTVCSRAVGLIPGRRAIIWEVRAEEGYEKWVP